MDFGTFFLSFWNGGAYTWEYFVFHQGCCYTYCLIVFISASSAFSQALLHIHHQPGWGIGEQCHVAFLLFEA